MERARFFKKILLLCSLWIAASEGNAQKAQVRFELPFAYIVRTDRNYSIEDLKDVLASGDVIREQVRRSYGGRTVMVPVYETYGGLLLYAPPGKIRERFWSTLDRYASENGWRWKESGLPYVPSTAMRDVPIGEFVDNFIKLKHMRWGKRQMLIGMVLTESGEIRETLNRATRPGELTFCFDAGAFSDRIVARPGYYPMLSAQCLNSLGTPLVPISPPVAHAPQRTPAARPAQPEPERTPLVRTRVRFDEYASAQREMVVHYNAGTRHGDVTNITTIDDHSLRMNFSPMLSMATSLFSSVVGGGGGYIQQPMGMQPIYNNPGWNSGWQQGYAQQWQQPSWNGQYAPGWQQPAGFSQGNAGIPFSQGSAGMPYSQGSAGMPYSQGGAATGFTQGVGAVGGSQGNAWNGGIPPGGTVGWNGR